MSPTARTTRSRATFNAGIVPGKHKVIIKCIDAKDHPIMTLVGQRILAS